MTRQWWGPPWHRPVLIALGAAFVVAVVLQAIGEGPSRLIDSSAYLPLPGDRFWAVNLWPNTVYLRAGFLLQLIYAVMPSDALRVGMQVAVSSIAWIVAVGFVLTRCERPVVKLLLAGVLLGFGSLPLVNQWNVLLLGESLVISLAVLMVAATAARPSGRSGLLGVTVCFGAGFLLLFTRPTNVTVVFTVLVLAVGLVRRRLGRGWAVGLLLGTVVVSMWSYVGVQRAERVTAAVGGYAMNRSYFRGDEKPWVAMERAAGRPMCAPFDEASHRPTLGAVEPTWKKYEATKQAVRTSCPELAAWLRHGGLTPLEAIVRSPIQVVRLFSSEAGETLSPPDYVGSGSKVEDFVGHPPAIPGFLAIGFALRALDKRTLRLPARGWALVIGSIMLILGNSLLLWLSDPMEVARHSLPWTLLLGPVLMTEVIVLPVRPRR